MNTMELWAGPECTLNRVGGFVTVRVSWAGARPLRGLLLRQPKLVTSIGGVKTPTDPGKQIISPEVATQVRDMLKGVLAPGGTASEVSVPGYTLAGKTGTAQIATEEGYSDTRYVASFMGLAPADNPAIAVSVMVNEPRINGHTGAEAAAPAFGELASFTLPYLGVPTE